MSNSINRLICSYSKYFDEHSLHARHWDIGMNDSDTFLILTEHTGFSAKETLSRAHNQGRWCYEGGLQHAMGVLNKGLELLT